MLSKRKNSYSLRQLFKRILISGAAVLLSVSFSGCYLFPKEVVVLKPPLKTPPQVTYDTMEVKRITLENKITGSGVFESINRQEYFFEFGGKKLKAIYVKAGQDVNPGDLLAELDSDDAEKKIKAQETVIQKAEISYNELITSSKLDIQSAKLDLDDLKKEYGRLTAIPGATPKTELEKLEKQIKQQEISYQKLLETNSTGEDGKKGSAILLAEISLNEERAYLNELKKELESCKLYCTLPGKVYFVDSSLKPGDSVQPFVKIIRVDDPTKLQLTYSGDRTSSFKLGTEVEVTVNSKPYKGTVVMTPASMPDDASAVLKDKVVIDVPDRPADTKIGTPATITLVTDRRENVIAVPRNVVRTVDNRNIVYVLKDNIRSERVVETGLQTQTMWEIVNGLEEGESVIVK